MSGTRSISELVSRAHWTSVFTCRTFYSDRELTFIWAATMSTIPDSNDPWPDFQQTETIDCAALFIDIRGSSDITARRTIGEEQVANLTTIFVGQVRNRFVEFAKSNNVFRQPATVRSYGDGLFCVWDLRQQSGQDLDNTKKTLLEAVISVLAGTSTSEGLGKQIRGLWQHTEKI